MEVLGQVAAGLEPGRDPEPVALVLEAIETLWIGSYDRSDGMLVVVVMAATVPRKLLFGN